MAREPGRGPTAEDEDATITRLLGESAAGDARAADALIPLVYGQLRRLAQSYLGGERTGHTLQATALVNEAYVRLSSRADLAPRSRDEFFAIAAQAMRRVLVDHARARKAAKRGGSGSCIPLDEAVAWFEDRRMDLPALDDALLRLAREDPRKAQLVELKFFAGLTLSRAAELIGVPLRTAERDWSLARAWLQVELTEGADPPA